MKKTKSTTIILKEWNKFLVNESTAGRVKQMIDELEKFKSQIIIKDNNPDAVTIEYKYAFTDGTRLQGSINCRSSKGVRLGRDDTKGIGQGEVNSTWYVTLTSQTTDGMGPLLYEVLIEYISSRKNAALKPDCTSVSDEARAVWEKFDKRSDIKKIQLDVDNSTVLNRRRGGQDIEQLTPDNVEDDTKQNTAIYDKGIDDWSSSSLSRAYRKDNTDLINDLLSRNLIEMPDPPKVYKSKLGGAWG